MAQVMIATVNSSPAYYEETYNSLKFTAITKQIKTLTNTAKTPQRVNAYSRRAPVAAAAAAAAPVVVDGNVYSSEGGWDNF
jgi:hypothetical protein